VPGCNMVKGTFLPFEMCTESASSTVTKRASSGFVEVILTWVASPALLSHHYVSRSLFSSSDLKGVDSNKLDSPSVLFFYFKEFKVPLRLFWWKCCCHGNSHSGLYFSLDTSGCVFHFGNLNGWTQWDGRFVLSCQPSFLKVFRYYSIFLTSVNLDFCVALLLFQVVQLTVNKISATLFMSYVNCCKYQ